MLRAFDRLRVVLILAVVASCGSDGAVVDSEPERAGSSSSETDVGAAPSTVVPHETGDTTHRSSIDRSRPEEATQMRILPVDGDLAEIVFALGFGDQVVATDISATYPSQADALPEIGYQRALSPEPIAAFEPTIVLATDVAGPTETFDALDDLSIATVVIDRESTPDGPANKIRAVAKAIGADGAGEALASDVDAQISTAIERAEGAESSPRVAVLYLRGENVQLVLGEGSGVDWIVDAAGAVDVADELGVIDNAPISAEALVAAAPEVVIVPRRGLDSVGGLDGLLAVPGIAATPAGESGRVLVYDDQLLLGNGPRTGALLDQLITDLHEDL